MFITSPYISVDLPEHAIERAAERLGMSEHEVVDFWREVVRSRQDELAEIEVGTGGRIIEGTASWAVARHSDFGARVMTVVTKKVRRR